MAWMEQQTGNERSQKETEDTTRTCSSGFGLCAAVTCHGTPPNQDQHTPTGCEDHMFCSKGAQKICSILHISMITGEIPHLITHPLLLCFQMKCRSMQLDAPSRISGYSKLLVYK